MLNISVLADHPEYPESGGSDTACLIKTIDTFCNSHSLRSARAPLPDLFIRFANEKKEIVLLADSEMKKDYAVVDIGDFPYFEKDSSVNYVLAKSFRAENDNVTVMALFRQIRYPELVRVDLHDLENASLIALADLLWEER